MNKITETDLSFSKKAWAQVNVAPLVRRTIVFNKGTAKGSIIVIPTGAQVVPNSKAGDNFLSIQVKKKLTKNITSLKINNAIPSLNPSTTKEEWNPDSDSIATREAQFQKINKTIRKEATTIRTNP